MVDKHDWNCHCIGGNTFKSCSPDFQWLPCCRCCFPAASSPGWASWRALGPFTPTIPLPCIPPEPSMPTEVQVQFNLSAQPRSLGRAALQPGRPLVPHQTLLRSSSCPLAAHPGSSLLWARGADQDACWESSSDLCTTGYHCGSPKLTYLLFSLHGIRR